jgi:lipoate-protein ligase B
MQTEILLVPLGLTTFQQAWGIQKQCHDRCQGTGENIVLITEHFPVISLGYRRQQEHLCLSRTELSERGISVIESDRGGGATYHGPGQLVIYAIFSTLLRKGGVRIFVSLLENVMQHLCESYGVCVERRPGFPGVWIAERKIGMVGISVHKGTSLHGLAVNINIDLRPFSYIVPCGLSEVTITSIAQEVQRPVDLSLAIQNVGTVFQRTFSAPIKEIGDEWRCAQ